MVTTVAPGAEGPWRVYAFAVLARLGLLHTFWPGQSPAAAGVVGSGMVGVTRELLPRRKRYLAMTDETRQPLTPEQRKARDAQRRADAEQAMREHEAAQKAFYENRDRLRAARLAREADAAE